MLATRFDRRVRKEATGLVREARAALLHKPDLRGKGGDLKTVAADMEQALGDAALGRVRVHLPVLDALVDELVERKQRSGVGSGVESLVTAILLALVLRAGVIEAFKIPSSSMYPTLEIGDHIFVNKFIYGLRIPWTTTKFFERSPARGDVIVFMQPCEPERDYIKRVVGLAGDRVEVRCNVVHINDEPIPSALVDGDCSYEDNASGAWEIRPCSRYRETVGGESYDTYQSALRPTHGPMPDERDFPRDQTAPSCATPEGGGRPAAAQLAGKVEPTAANASPGSAEPTRPSVAGCELHTHYVVPAGHVFVMGDNRANSNDSRYWGSVPLDHIKGKALFIWLSYRDALTDLSGFRWPRIGNFVD